MVAPTGVCPRKCSHSGLGSALERADYWNHTWGRKVMQALVVIDMSYSGGETTQLIYSQRVELRKMESKFFSYIRLGNAEVFLIVEVIILESERGRALSAHSCPLARGSHPSSVFLSFPRCLENLISSPRPLRVPLRSCPALPWTALIYSSCSPISLWSDTLFWCVELSGIHC